MMASAPADALAAVLITTVLSKGAEPARPPSPVVPPLLSPPQQEAVNTILHVIPVAAPAAPVDDADKKLQRQKVFIQTYAIEINKIIAKKLVALLEGDPRLQERLGIKLEKNQTISLQGLLEKMNKILEPEDRKLAQDEDFCWMEANDDEIQAKKREFNTKLSEISKDLITILENFDVKIEEGCPELVVQPLEKQLQKAIDEYVDSKFDMIKVVKKGAPAVGAAWFLLKLANKFNSFGGFTMLYDTAAVALKVLS